MASSRTTSPTRASAASARVSLEQQAERLTDAYLANVLQLDEYKRRRLELEQRLSVIAEQKRQLEANVGHHDQLAGMVQSIEAFCQRVQHGLSEATFEQKRQLIELLIDRVVVTGEEVEIRYAIPTSPKGESIRFCHLRLDYFDGPMISDRREHACWGSLLHREATESIDHLMARLIGLEDACGAFEPKDLLNAFPLFGTPGIEIRAAGDVSVCEPPMSFVPRLGLFPTTPIGRAILKEIRDILVQRRLIVLGNQERVPSTADGSARRAPVGYAWRPA